MFHKEKQADLLSDDDVDDESDGIESESTPYLSTDELATPNATPSTQKTGEVRAEISSSLRGRPSFSPLSSHSSQSRNLLMDLEHSSLTVSSQNTVCITNFT